MRRFLGILILLLIFVGLGSFRIDPSNKVQIPFQKVESSWVDSLMKNMSLDEKIGQLFMVAAYSNKGEEHDQELNTLINDYGIGGLIFFQGGPMRQANMTNRLQSKSKVPLLIGMDAEWGLSMRLDSTNRYPREMMLGAASDPAHAFAVGQAIGEELKALGVHVSFSPVLDVNNNPNNPVINSRSFGEDVGRVGVFGRSFAQGLQSVNVIAVGKHFPGHGDTDVDSHKDLPVVNHSRSRLEKLEFLPFKQSIDWGVSGIMVAHMHVPALDSTPELPSSLSKPIVTGVLRNEMAFNGLVFTDALNMKGVTKYYKPGDADLQALLAGNDVLLFPEDVKSAVTKIKQAIKKGNLTEQELDQHVLRILKAKAWVGLADTANLEINKADVKKAFQNPYHDLINRNAHAASMTLIKNDDQLLPFQDLESKHLISISLGNSKTGYDFQEHLLLYDRVNREYLPKKPTSFERQLIYDQIDDQSVVIVSLHDTKLSPQGNFGITQESLDFITEISEKAPTVVVHFGNPYALAKLKDTPGIKAVLVAYEEGRYAQLYAAEALFGGIVVNAKLPVSINEQYPEGAGLKTEKSGRFHYTEPEAVNISSEVLKGIDSIAQFGIDEQAYPGCQILVAKNNQVIYQKTFGHHTYENNDTVKWTDIYDLASITKVASTVASVMKLDDQGLIDVNKTLGDYIPEWVGGTEYADMQLREMLTHQAGLKAWIPFYNRALSKGVPRYDVFSLGQSELYPYRVAENIYISKNYPDSIIRQIVETPLNKKREYLYSDLGYYFLKLIVEKQTGVPLNQFADSVFYQPMGLYSTGYLPRNKFDLDQIVPTEYDLFFRKQLVHGDVHDPGAAMMGGVGGHAGLFSNANDLAKIMQMFMDGSYGNVQYLSDSVVHEYTKCMYCIDDRIENRRGLGFDKPVTDGEGGPTCQCVSLASFGHTGFTGTIGWADPEANLVYIFLSNRVYPDAQNKKLISLNIRTDIMQVIYDANNGADINPKPNP